MRVIVLSDADPVARGVAAALGRGEPSPWHVGEHRLRLLDPETLLLHRPGLHIEDATLGEELPLGLAAQIDAVIFPSVHSSAAGTPAFAVHPLGNLSDAHEVGGAARWVNPVPARWMTETFLRLQEPSRDLGVELTFEATHHGPALRVPSFFVEAGSSPEVWEDPRFHEAIARALRELRLERTLSDSVALGVGGGHYMPRFKDLVRQRRLSVGHLVPSRALPTLDREMVEQLVARTPGVQGVFFAKASEAEGSPWEGLLEKMGEKGLGVRGSDPPRPACGAPPRSSAGT